MKYKNLTYLMTHPLILMWFMILGAIAMLLLGRQSRTWYNQYIGQQQNFAITAPQRSIGQSVRLEGEIDGQYGFGMLYLDSDAGQKFIIKSTTTNINQLTGEVVVHGTITEYNGFVPVVNIYQYESDSLPQQPQLWYDHVSTIVFRPGYDADTVSSGDLITITDPIVNREVVKIRTLVCDGTGNTDECGIEQSTDLPYFISSYRHKFVQGDGVWYVFGDGVAYRIWASEQYYLTQMAQYFDLANERLMAELIRKELKVKCIGPQTNVVEYVSHRMREQNDNTFAIVRGLSSQKKLSVCQLKLITDNHHIGFESITTIPVEE